MLLRRTCGHVFLFFPPKIVDTSAENAAAVNVESKQDTNAVPLSSGRASCIEIGNAEACRFQLILDKRPVRDVVVAVLLWWHLHLSEACAVGVHVGGVFGSGVVHGIGHHADVARQPSVAQTGRTRVHFRDHAVGEVAPCQ